MLTYNMDVEERSTWLRATPGAAALAQPFYCTEAGNFYGRAHFATARTDKESYLLFYTLSGSGLIEQNDQRVALPAGSALLLNCRTPQSYCTAPGQDHWHHYWAHLDLSLIHISKSSGSAASLFFRCRWGLKWRRRRPCSRPDRCS